MTTLRFDAVAGALSTALTAGQTTMYSDGLADMGTVASPDTASITLFISDSNGRVLSYEVVTVTAHTSGATSATITRNVESRNIPSGGWIIGTRWDHAATAADFSASSGLTSFQGRTTAAATLTKADVTGTGLTYSDVGADASGAASAVQSNLNTEATARASADTALSTSIATEASARASADSTLSTAISTETTRATAAEATKAPLTSLFRSQKALRFALPSQSDPLVSAPTISLANANPGSTPTQWTSVVSGAASSAFTLCGAEPSSYMVAGQSFPSSSSLRMPPRPSSPTWYGEAVVEFDSDATTITVPQVRAELGSVRIMVDDTEVLRCGTATRTGTAQAGGASTITLDSGASATNGFYINQWVRTVGGTGAGQFAQITGYVGATKVATIAPSWTTAPDATTTFEITQVKMNYTTSTQSGYGTYYHTLSWGGERRLRRYRVECAGTAWLGCYVDSSIASVLPAPRPTGIPKIHVGDSFSFGTGSDAGLHSSMARICADELGCDLRNLSIGGTGYLNTGTGSLKVRDRLFPAYNSWLVNIQGTGAGTYTLTQNGNTTAAISNTATTATVQSAVDTAFGAGNFVVSGDSTGGRYVFLTGQGSYGAQSYAMTMASSFATAPGTVTRWAGDLAPQIPKDGSGNALPFLLTLACGHNDTRSSNSAYTASAVSTELTTLVNQITSAYPTAIIVVWGAMYLPGGSANAATTGTAQAGSTSTTIKLASGASATDNAYTDQTVTITGGTGSGQTGLITGYVGSTKVATISTTWGVTPDATSTYSIGPAQLVLVDQAIQTVVTTSVPKINNKVPYIQTIYPNGNSGILTTSWMTGTGSAGALAANGNSDLTCWTDGVHPTPEGHQVYGRRFAMAESEIYGG